MKIKSALAISLVCFGMNFTHADMINISTNGFHGKNDPQIACSIVSTSGQTYNGYRILFIFAESSRNGFDPMLVAQSLDYQYEMINLDWRGITYLNDEPLDPEISELFGPVLRTPNSNLDAAVIFFAVPGETLCAYSYEETVQTGLYGVNTSITDVTPRVISVLSSDETRKFVENLRERFEAQKLAR